MSFEMRKSKVLIQLLKGPIYQESSAVLWQDFLVFREQIQEYFSHLGLFVYVHEDFGFCFLKQENGAIDKGLRSGKSSTSTVDEENSGHGDNGSDYTRTTRNSSFTDDTVAEEFSLPRLVQQRDLSFELSVLLVLLRKRLAEHDNLSGDPRLILDERDVLQMLRIFLPDTNNDVKQKKEVDGLIEKAIDMGVLRRMSHDLRKLEVLRILAALFDASRLSELDQRIEEYKAYAQKST